MNVELFVLDERTKLVDINKEWISTIKEFKKILRRDRGSEGDAEGKKKLQATKEFTFIYHLVDYRSQFDNYSEADKEKQSASNAELPADFDYRKDEDLVLAIKRYHTLQDVPSLKMLNEAKEGLHTAHKVIRKIRTSLETKIEAAEFDELTTEENKQGKTIIVDPVAKLTNSLKALMTLTNEIGPAMKTIKDLTEQVKKELSEKESLRGNKMKGAREDQADMKVLGKAVNLHTEESEESQGTGTAGMFDDL